MKSKIFFSVTLGFLLGGIFGSRLHIAFLDALILLLISFSICLFLYFRRRKSYKLFQDHVVLASLVIFSTVVGIIRFAIVERSLQSAKLIRFDGQSVEIIGKVISEPQRKTDLNKVNVGIIAVATASTTLKINDETIALYIDSFKQVSYGDLLILKGKLERIKNRVEESNFDFESYAKKDGVLFQMFRPDMKFQKNIANPIVLKLKQIKNFFETKLASNLSEPHASLVSGMLISGKNALPQDIQNEFIRTGLIHIVVLSGFNIAIIIRFLSSIFSVLRLNRHISFILILSTLILFVLMAGATPPVIRAVLMASIVLLGKVTYRQMDANKVLIFVASILAFINPYSAPFDPSFQLSFLATFSIINLSPILERYFRFIRSDILRETVSQTLSATIFVSPFVLYLMGNFSVVALLVNVIILPFVPILMLFGFLLVALSFIPFVSVVISFIVIALSSILFAVVGFASSLPFASFSISSLPFIAIVPVYIAIFLFIYKKKREVILPASPVINLTEPH